MSSFGMEKRQRASRACEVSCKCVSYKFLRSSPCNVPQKIKGQTTGGMRLIAPHFNLEPRLRSYRVISRAKPRLTTRLCRLVMPVKYDAFFKQSFPTNCQTSDLPYHLFLSGHGCSHHVYYRFAAMPQASVFRAPTVSPSPSNAASQPPNARRRPPKAPPLPHPRTRTGTCLFSCFFLLFDFLLFLAFCRPPPPSSCFRHMSFIICGLPMFANN